MAVLGEGGPPPAPQLNQNGSPNTGGVLSAPQAPSIVPNQGPASAAAGVPATPTPSHGQTIAVLRHMDAIQAELEILLKDPAAGKSNLKSKIIDGVTKLVAGRIMTAGAAVSQLASVPAEPFQQRKWLLQHLVQTFMAKIAVQSHHGAAFGGMPDVDQTSSPDDHLADMQSVMGHYGGIRNA